MKIKLHSVGWVTPRFIFINVVTCFWFLWNCDFLIKEISLTNLLHSILLEKVDRRTKVGMWDWAGYHFLFACLFKSIIIIILWLWWLKLIFLRIKDSGSTLESVLISWPPAVSICPCLSFLTSIEHQRISTLPYIFFFYYNVVYKVNYVCRKYQANFYHSLDF